MYNIFALPGLMRNRRVVKESDYLLGSFPFFFVGS